MMNEKCKASKKIFDGIVLSLRVDDVELEDGRRAVREVVEHKSAVGVLALTERDTVLLVKQFRYAVGADMLEICAGIVEDGEDFETTAARELQEELGYFPHKLQKIACLYATPGYCSEKIAIFLATELEKSKLKPDDDENIECVEIPVSEIPKLLESGKIEDGKTWSALVWFLANNCRACTTVPFDDD